MPLTFRKLSDLTPGEVQACQAYQGDATLYHATAQGWCGQFPDSARFAEFIRRVPTDGPNLKSAIDKYVVDEPGTVYSGHGLGFSVLGSLVGLPEQYIGLKFVYPGFTSASADRAAAENFLRTRAKGAIARPVLLEIELETNQRALPVGDVTGADHEGEILLPAKAQFEITKAFMIGVDQVDADVLTLILRSA